jgi:hypothetical protein
MTSDILGWVIEANRMGRILFDAGIARYEAAE